MDKIRYWKKQYYNAIMLYEGLSDLSHNPIFTRAFNIVCEIGDYLFELEESVYLLWN